MKKLLFIPCYNDLFNLKKLLNEIEKLDESKTDILVINDGSSERFNLQLKKKNLKVISFKHNYGIGFCIKFAINYALINNYNKFCRIDSDGEHNPKYINKIFKILDHNEFVLGNRKINFKQNYLKIISKKLITFIINKSYDLKIFDYNCGMMGLSKSAMKKLKNDYFINYPEPQIILKLMKQKFQYEVININQRKRYSGNSSISFFNGLDFFLITLFFVLNRILNNSDD